MKEIDLTVQAQKTRLQDMLNWEKGGLVTPHNRRMWFMFIAAHYKTLKLVSIEEVVPDEIVAELILERLV